MLEAHDTTRCRNSLLRLGRPSLHAGTQGQVLERPLPRQVIRHWLLQIIRRPGRGRIRRPAYHEDGPLRDAVAGVADPRLAGRDVAPARRLRLPGHRTHGTVAPAGRLAAAVRAFVPVSRKNHFGLLHGLSHFPQSPSLGSP